MLDEDIYDAVDLEKDLTNLIMSIEVFQGKPDNMYHYTTLSGMDGIFSNRHMRFSRIDVLNDSSEVQYCHDMIIKMLDCYGRDDKKEEYANNLIEEIMVKNNELHSMTVPRGRDKADAYLMCSEVYVGSFSIEKDLLDMWKYYSKGEGVCMCIKNEENYGIYRKIDDVTPLKDKYIGVRIDKYFARVCYNNEKQMEILSYVIEKGYESFKRFCGCYKEDIFKRYWSSTFYRNVIFPLSLFMKHPSFLTERECRIVITKNYAVDKVDNWGAIAFDGKYPNKYLVKEKIVPYIEYGINLNNIQGVMESPISKVKNKILKEYLLKMGMKGVEVSNSKIPFRSY